MAIEPPGDLPGPNLWFAFRGNEMLVQPNEARWQPPISEDIAELGLPVVRQQFLGFLDGQPCFSCDLANDCETPNGMAFHGLRKLFGKLSEAHFGLAGRALQIVSWERTHQFCGRCGEATETVVGERAKRCPGCGLTCYPRLSPAVIVLIERGDELLLARSNRLPEGMYSVLAGFVEPGETLEEAVHREVAEEAGISLKNVRYFGSQPWPFPNSLMIGFTAEYASGKLDIDYDELEDAGWYSPDTLPVIPGKMSIARRLIDHFLDKRRSDKI